MTSTQRSRSSWLQQTGRQPFQSQTRMRLHWYRLSGPLCGTWKPLGQQLRCMGTALLMPGFHLVLAALHQGPGHSKLLLYSSSEMPCSSTTWNFNKRWMT
jgi:hypothetical protein